MVSTRVREVTIEVNGEAVGADLTLPPEPVGVVVFAHGSGSGRHSPRNRMVAGRLHDRGLATLLLDLLTDDEERADARSGHLRFDIDFLATRLLTATAWVRGVPSASALPVCFFGASTGAAAALLAAARRPEGIAAIVSRGGRADLAGQALGRVRAPTLLIVGQRDEMVVGLNQKAMNRMHVERQLVIVPGATHLFTEPGALEEVARLAGDWFVDHLGRRTSAAGGNR